MIPNHQDRLFFCMEETNRGSLRPTKECTAFEYARQKHQSKIDKLAQFSGAEFDRKYMGDMVSDHKEDVNKFQKETTEDPHVQKWASKTLPTLFEGEPPGGPKRRPTSPGYRKARQTVSRTFP